MKPATSLQVLKMYNKVQILAFFPKFSIIRIDKLSLNHKFWDFILILNALRGVLRTKCFVAQFFSIGLALFPFCFCGNTDVALNDHCGSDGFILKTWTLSSCEIVKLKLMTYIPQHLYIYQNLEIPVFCVPLGLVHTCRQNRELCL